MTELLEKTNDYKQERRIHPYSGAIICGICRKKILHVQKFLIGEQSVLSVLCSRPSFSDRRESSPNIEKTAASSLRDSVLLLRIKKYPDHISTKTPVVCGASCRRYKNTRQMRQCVYEMAVSYEASSQTLVQRRRP